MTLAADLPVSAQALRSRGAGGRLSPNPTAGQLRLTDLPQGAADYRVLTLTGQELAHGQLKGGRLDLTSLTPGTYFLQVSNGETGERWVERFVKQ